MYRHCAKQLQLFPYLKYVLERINREIKRRTKVVGTFPDGESALMLVCARLRHITSSVWGTKRYLNMEHLRSMEREKEIESAV